MIQGVEIINLLTGYTGKLETFLMLIIAILFSYIYRLNYKYNNLKNSETIKKLNADKAYENQIISNQLIEEKSRLMEELRQKAEFASQTKSQFLAHISHEIRTPLTSIIGFTEQMLCNSYSEDDFKNQLKVVLRNSRHMLRLVNEVLDLSKIEAGKFEIIKENIRLMNLVFEVATLLRPNAEKKQLDLQVVPEFPLPELIYTDGTRLKQAIFNLLDNAIKFTKEGSVRIVFRADFDTSKIIFSVEDTGIGMSDIQQEKIFSYFTQASKTISRDYGGSGLGLYISREVVKKLGGDIKVSSRAGFGSTFEFSIDAGDISASRRQDKFDVNDDFNDYLPFVPEKFEGTVLLAEDMPDTQVLLSSILSQHGLKVQVVDNGKAVLDAAGKNTFDIIFMDMQMPVMSGIEAITVLRRKGYYGPVVALTANMQTADVEECYQAGCDGCLGKPFERQTLQKLLALYLVKQDMTISLPENETFERASKDFIRLFDARIEELEKALKNSDYDNLAKMAHKIAGAAAFAYREIYKLLEDLEIAASKKSPECTVIIKLIKARHTQCLLPDNVTSNPLN